MKKQIAEFISNWKNEEKTVDEHVDFFIPNQKIFYYEQVVDVINQVHNQCVLESMNNMDVYAYIECGSSKHLQKWGEEIWRLVDNSRTPPNIVMGERLVWRKHDLEEIVMNANIKDKNLINIYTCHFDGELYTRRLFIINRRMIEENE